MQGGFSLKIEEEERFESLEFINSLENYLKNKITHKYWFILIK